MSVSSTRTAVTREAIRPWTVAYVSLVTVVAVNVAVVTTVFAAAGPSADELITAGRLAGLYAALLMACQLILVARLPWLDRRLGMDRLISWHRWAGIGLVWLLTAHAVLIVSGYAHVHDVPATTAFADLTVTTAGVLRAVVAFVLIMVVGGLSARYARRRLAYETWHFIHLYAYAAVLLAFSHQITVGQSFVGSPTARAYWWLLWGTALTALVLGRVVLPLWRNLRHRLRVAAVVPESPDVVSVYVTGKRLAELPAMAGQFFLWRFLTRDKWWQANPYSLSAAPDGESLRLTVKALGAGSAGLRYLRPGTRVFAEGPYGAFTTLRRRKRNAVLIAGGIGITPIRALLEDLHGHVILIYRVGRPREAVLLPELSMLAPGMHLLIGPPDAANRYGPLLGAGNLLSLAPDIRDRDVFVCGPPGMMRAAMRSLWEIGVPRDQVHAERFSLAT
jgi:predicted ferric reductase